MAVLFFCKNSIPPHRNRFVHAALILLKIKMNPSLSLCHHSCRRFSCISVHAASIFLLYLSVHADLAKGYTMFLPPTTILPDSADF